MASFWKLCCSLARGTVSPKTFFCDEKPNSDVERNFDSFVSTDRNTPDALLEQPTHSSPNPMATRRRSKRLNRE